MLAVNKVYNFITNKFLSRSSLFNRMIDEKRDINQEAGYPDIILSEHYKLLYDREGIAARVVSLFPEESWVIDPEIKETEEADESEFEQAWIDLQKKFNLYHYMERADELSGIGPFGIVLFGIDDGKKLNEPVDGINDLEEKVGGIEHKLLFVRTFPDSNVDIDAYELNETNPRFGKPTIYSIQFSRGASLSSGNTQSPDDTITHKVHWTRVIHLADNRKASEVFGKPRMQDVFNRLYDLRKILAGSGEMFWKGAFPGYSFEINPDVADGTAEIDPVALREEFERYSNGLQRYLALTGLTAKSLSVQAVDPGPHAMVQLKAIAISLGVPLRIFIGSEEAKLASDQDKKAFNARIARRQNKYLTPMLITPIINRLIVYGALLEPKKGLNGYTVTWADLNTRTNKDKAEVADKLTTALAKYVAANVDSLVPPKEFFTIFLELSNDEADAILDAAAKMLGETEEGDGTDNNTAHLDDEEEEENNK